MSHLNMRVEKSEATSVKGVRLAVVVFSCSCQDLI